jgi:glucose-1-phosphate adenylyltransferase
VAKSRVLLLVLAGGAGGRLELLTEHRAKPAVPYGGAYRLVDFPLSNAHHSGIDDVWLVEQFNPVSINDHLANGRPWDLDRTVGGLLVLGPRLGSDRPGWHQGTADAVWRQAPLIREFAPEHLVIVSADAVYRLDYAAVVGAHAEAGADLTMVTTRRPVEEAGRYGVVQVRDDGRIGGYAYKPEEPASDVVATEVFVFRPDRLLDVLGGLAERAGDEGLADLGDEALPALVRDGTAVEYRLDSYWRDVGTVAAYLSSHLELTGEDAPIRLDDPEWPVLTANAWHGTARVDRGGEVLDTLLSPGCRVAGRVERSVLSPGAFVAPGAQVSDCVLLTGAVVEPGARLHRTVVDARATVGGGARLGVDADRRAGSAADATDDVVLVGTGQRVPEGTVLAPGSRFGGG